MNNYHESNDDYLGYIMTPSEEEQYFFDTCDRIIANPRFYLDHLNELYVFRIRQNTSNKRKLYK